MTLERLAHIQQSYDRAHKQVRSKDDEADWYNNGHTYIAELYEFAKATLEAKQ
jgi:hypothetical protein